MKFYNGRWWRTGDRVECPPFGSGSILDFRDHGFETGSMDVIVRFDNPAVGVSVVQLFSLNSLE